MKVVFPDRSKGWELIGPPSWWLFKSVDKRMMYLVDIKADKKTQNTYKKLSKEWERQGWRLITREEYQKEITK